MRQPGRRGQLAELGDLVLAERLGREQQQGPRRRVVGDRLQDRQRVAQRLARRGRRDDDDVLDRRGPTSIASAWWVYGRAMPRASEPGHDPRIEPVGEVGVLRRRVRAGRA